MHDLRDLMARAAADADLLDEDLSQLSWARARERRARSRLLVGGVLGATVVAVAAVALSTGSPAPQPVPAVPEPTQENGAPASASFGEPVILLEAEPDADLEGPVRPATAASVEGRSWSMPDLYTGRADPHYATFTFDGATVTLDSCLFTMTGEGSVEDGRLLVRDDSWVTRSHPPTSRVVCDADIYRPEAWRAALQGATLAVTVGPDALLLALEPDTPATSLAFVREDVQDPRPGPPRPVDLTDLASRSWRQVEPPAELVGDRSWADPDPDHDLRLVLDGDALRFESECGSPRPRFSALLGQDEASWAARRDVGDDSSRLVALFVYVTPLPGCLDADREAELKEWLLMANVLAGAPALQISGDYLLVHGWDTSLGDW